MLFSPDLITGFLVLEQQLLEAQMAPIGLGSDPGSLHRHHDSVNELNAHRFRIVQFALQFMDTSCVTYLCYAMYFSLINNCIKLMYPLIVQFIQGYTKMCEEAQR